MMRKITIHDLHYFMTYILEVMKFVYFIDGNKIKNIVLNSNTVICFHVHCNDRRFAPKYLSSFCSYPKMFFRCCDVAKQR